MGYYWTPTSLVPLMPQVVPGVMLITPTSHPINADDLETIIQLTEGAVAGAAAEAGYVFPVSTAASVAWGYVRQVVRDGVIAQTIETLSPGARTSKQYRTAYDDAMKAIREGKVTLLSAEILDADSGGRQSVAGEGYPTPLIADGYQW